MDIERRHQKYKDLDWYMYDLSAEPNEEVLRKWNRIQLPRRSALLMLVHDRYRNVTSRDSIAQQILAGRRSKEIDRLLDNAKDLLDKFRTLASSQGFRLTVVAIPFSGQINHSYENEMYQSVLRAYLSESDIEFQDLLPSFQMFYQENGRIPLLPFDGHYDTHGNEVMATAIATDQIHCPI